MLQLLSKCFSGCTCGYCTREALQRSHIITTFPAYVIDSSSVLTGGSPVVTIAGNTLEINFAGLTFQPGEQLALDFGASAPEPATFGLLGVPLASLSLLKRRRAA
jgi:hypothetical protein